MSVCKQLCVTEYGTFSEEAPCDYSDYKMTLLFVNSINSDAFSFTVSNKAVIGGQQVADCCTSCFIPG